MRFLFCKYSNKNSCCILHYKDKSDLFNSVSNMFNKLLQYSLSVPKAKILLLFYFIYNRYQTIMRYV